MKFFRTTSVLERGIFKMKIKKRLSWLFFVTVALSVALFLIYSPIANAQNWAALAPYNTLWPLWSPVLSPLDAAGVAVPIVSELTGATILPVEPGLTWNPSLSYPWLLYNTPLGMAYFDPIGGVDLWPPPSLTKPNGSIKVLDLPTGFATLPVTPSSFITNFIPVANPAAVGFLSTFPGTFPNGILPVYLGAGAFLPPPILPPPILAPVVPLPVIPAPTASIIVAPPLTTIAPAVTSGIFFPFFPRF